MLSAIFHSEADQRDFEFSFEPAPDGSQQNDCRDLFVEACLNHTLENCLAIAQRLQLNTDNRSGIGLVFIMAGDHGGTARFVVSRFPADEAILAEVEEGGLGVEYLERVFIKKMSSYKAVLLHDKNPAAEFWQGWVTDRQAGGGAENISSYWLKDFLNADFAETPQVATRRLAEALKKAIKANPNIDVKTEIASAISLAPGAMQGKQTSIAQFCDHFGFSEDSKLTIQTQLSKPSLFDKTFVFDRREFSKRLSYRTVEMDNGAILTAPSENFAKTFEVKQMDDGTFEYSTRGHIADERIAKS